MSGFAETFARWGALLDNLGWVCVNGFTYEQPQPFDLPGPDGPPSHEHIVAEIGRRTEVAAGAFANKIWRDVIEQWDTELKSASIARHRELGDVDLASLTEDELAAHVDACVQHFSDMAYQHHRFNGSAIIVGADFALQASGWIGEPPTDLFGVFDGYSPASGVLCPEIEPALAALRGDPGALDILHAAAAASARLAELGTRLPAVGEFVRSIGFRLVDGFDITFPTGLERPQVLLGRLDAALEVDPSEAIARADALAAALRERVPAEHIAEFDDLLAESRYVNRLRDERGLYSDVAAVGILRLALLEYGSRLAQRGAINTPSDIRAINGGELADLRTGGSTLSASDLAERSAWVAAISDHGAPRYLGDPPPDPPPMDQLPPPLARVMQAIGFGIEGILGQLDEAQGDETHVAGIGVHEGVYEGPVYLVSSIDDLFEIQQGDVLVSQTTGGAFNSMIHLVGAIVTDHGSYISHAAIVARECGLPAVVGCINATERLQQGQRVRVDGGTGEVIVLA